MSRRLVECHQRFRRLAPILNGIQLPQLWCWRCVIGAAGCRCTRPARAAHRFGRRGLRGAVPLSPNGRSGWCRNLIAPRSRRRRPRDQRAEPRPTAKAGIWSSYATRVSYRFASLRTGYVGGVGLSWGLQLSRAMRPRSLDANRAQVSSN
jgi:hypothetical protein